MHFKTCGLFNFRLCISTKPARLSVNPILIFPTTSKHSNLSIFKGNYIFKFSSIFMLLPFLPRKHLPLVTNRRVVLLRIKNKSSHVVHLPFTGAPEEVEGRRVGGARGRRGRRRWWRGRRCGASGEASEAVQGEDGEQREMLGGRWWEKRRGAQRWMIVVYYCNFAKVTRKFLRVCMQRSFVWKLDGVWWCHAGMGRWAFKLGSVSVAKMHFPWHINFCNARWTISDGDSLKISCFQSYVTSPGQRFQFSFIDTYKNT